jgi:hypothetical protein
VRGAGGNAGGQVQQAELHEVGVRQQQIDGLVEKRLTIFEYRNDFLLLYQWLP